MANEFLTSKTWTLLFHLSTMVPGKMTKLLKVFTAPKQKKIQWQRYSKQRGGQCCRRRFRTNGLISEMKIPRFQKMSLNLLSWTELLQPQNSGPFWDCSFILHSEEPEAARVDDKLGFSVDVCVCVPVCQDTSILSSLIGPIFGASVPPLQKKLRRVLVNFMKLWAEPFDIFWSIPKEYWESKNPRSLSGFCFRTENNCKLRAKTCDDTWFHGEIPSTRIAPQQCHTTFL